MKRLYLAQINNTFGGQAFLPYSVGMLWSYAHSFSDLAASYELGDLLFLREPLSRALNRINDPDVLALSCYLWNWNYNMDLITLVKRRYPGCIVICGGPEVPSDSRGFLEANPDIDFLVHDEGEVTFADLLRALRDGQQPSSIEGISYRHQDIPAAAPHGSVCHTQPLHHWSVSQADRRQSQHSLACQPGDAPRLPLQLHFLRLGQCCVHQDPAV